MRSMLMFDLPVETVQQRREYRKFVKFLKESGFIMFQESVYVKLSINESSVNSLVRVIRDHVPAKGIVSMITVTERQFSSIDFMQGDFKTDVIDNEKRVVEL
jgi:CRISPR-associated protein Cas2